MENIAHFWVWSFHTDYYIVLCSYKTSKGQILGYLLTKIYGWKSQKVFSLEVLDYIKIITFYPILYPCYEEQIYMQDMYEHKMAK